MPSSRFAFAPIVAAALLLAGACGDPPPPAPFEVYVRVEGDPGKPIEGATITRGGKQLAVTNVEGRAMLKLAGAEGEIADVTVTCPAGFSSPKSPTNVRLTRLADKTKVPEYPVACPPNVRRVVVAVRAENGPNLPVLYLGKAITKTDESGAAHFALEVAPGAQFQVVLDTAERKDIKPQQPAKIFVVSQQDEILLFDQKFEVERKVTYVPRPVVNIPRPISR